MQNVTLCALMLFVALAAGCATHSAVSGESLANRGPYAVSWDRTRADFPVTYRGGQYEVSSTPQETVDSPRRKRSADASAEGGGR